jgi:hypothetical protein
MNQHPGKNLSIAFSKVAATKGFSSALHYFQYRTVAYTTCTVDSGHKLATRIWIKPFSIRFICDRLDRSLGETTSNIHAGPSHADQRRNNPKVVGCLG